MKENWKRIPSVEPAVVRGAESQWIRRREFSGGSSLAAKSFVAWWQKFPLQLVHRGIIGSTRRDDGAADNYRYRTVDEHQPIFEWGGGVSLSKRRGLTRQAWNLSIFVATFLLVSSSLFIPSYVDPSFHGGVYNL